MTRTRVWLDCDTGSDDAIAIMAAALHPDLDLVGVSCVNGNVTLDHVVDNTLRVLAHIDVDVPVYAGANRPLLRPDFPIPRHVLNPKGSAFHADTLPLPASRFTQARTAAAQAIVEAFMADGGDDIVLVPTGPLTNIALALALEPGLAARVRRLVLMGGARGHGNVSGAAEFNIWVDPEAAQVVLSSGIRDVLVVPLDATHSAPISRQDCHEYESLGTPAGVAAAELIRHRIVGYGDREDGGDTAPVHDALCLAAIVHPEVITESIDASVYVETRGERTIGATIIDDRNWREEAPNARFALRADSSIFARFLAEAFRH